MKALADTHILVWWLAEPRRLSAEQRRVLGRLSAKSPLLVSDISLWEIATLVRRGRLTLDHPLRDWLEAAVAPPLVERVGISPAIAAEVAALPDAIHRDPADRVLIATARVHGATLLTQDERLLRSKLVSTLG